MKKKFLTLILSIFLIIPAMFMLTACSTTADNVQVRVQDGYVQWSSNDSEWQNVISIDEILEVVGDDIKGEQGIQGPQGVAGKQVEFNVSSTYIQWRYVGETSWKNLIALSGLKGKDGIDGIDGREVEFRQTTYYIQWRYVNSNQGAEENWKILVALSDLKGEDGIDGTKWYTCSGEPDISWANYGDFCFSTSTSNVYQYYKSGNESGGIWVKIANLNANVEKVTVNFDLNLPEYMYEFDDYIASNSKLQSTSIDKGSWLELENFEGEKLKNYFLGWYIGEGIDETKITSYTSINADCTLTAKWDYDKIDEIYTSAGVTYRSWLNNTVVVSLTSNCGDVVHIAKTYNGKTISLVNGFAEANNTSEVILPGCASTGYNGYAIQDEPIETWNNTTLTKVSWYGEETATDIGQYSFYGCTALTEISLPETIKNIGDSAFENCNTLTLFNLRQTETIGKKAFYNCSSLATTVSGIFFITETVKEIGNNAFEGCTSLTKICIESIDVINLTNNDSYLFSYVDTILIRKSITTNKTAYIDDSQGHFTRKTTSSGNTHDQLIKIS
ncbi:MAG: leucine-rich repeat domain-containing protein [Candidatus Onthoplasma sp.]